MREESYKEFYRTVRDIFIDVDPLGLIAGGAPLDEYDMEVGSLLPLLRKCNSQQDVEEALSSIMLETLEVDELPMEVKKDLSSRLFGVMKESGWNSN